MSPCGLTSIPLKRSALLCAGCRAFACRGARTFSISPAWTTTPARIRSIKRHSPHAPSADATPKEGSAPGGQLWGNDFRDAYVPGTTLTGAGQNLGLLEFEGYYAQDIANYEDAIGMSADQQAATGYCAAGRRSHPASRRR